MAKTSRGWNRRLLWNIWFYLLLTNLLFLGWANDSWSATQEAPKKVATAVRLEDAITLDGKLDEPAWQKAPEQTGFEMPLSSANRKPIPKEMQTSFRVLYDDNNLYFGIRCNESKPENLVVQAARQHDAAMWSDDDVELFFDPVGDRNEYYQLTINSEGTKVDLYWIEGGNTGKGGWSSEWQTAVYKGDKFWSLETVIPLALFHNRPSRTWAERWVFSIARTRSVSPDNYFSQFSPANGYHDVKNFGYLDGIKVDKSRFNLYAESPSFRLEPAENGFKVLATLSVENRGDQPYQGTLAMDIQTEGAKGSSVPLQLSPSGKTRVQVPDGFVLKQGKWPVIFRAEGENKAKTLIIRFDNWMTYTPLTIRVTQPNYRNNIYAGQSIDAIKGRITLGMPLEQVGSNILRVGLSSCIHTGVNVEIPVDKIELPFELPAKGLPIGKYVVRAELLRPISNPKLNGPKFDLVNEQEVALQKLPPAPVVEARVDDQGNLLINGEPVFIR
ncbi:MAG: sugar-binding protein, partial [Verrucomicrobiota bacterium]